MHHLHRRDEDRLIADRIADAAHILLCHSTECLARERLIHRARHALEVRERCTVGNLDDTVFDESCIRHEDGNRVTEIKRQELQHAERGLCGLRCKHERHVMCHIGDEARRFLEHLIEPPHAPFVPIVNLCLLGVRHRSDGLQPVDVEAIALRRRNTPGGCVRMLQITEHFQIRHFVANGGRADAEIVLLRKRP